MSALGTVFGIALYVLVGFHVHAVFNVILPALKRRIGEPATLVWISFGLIILYNLCFNHFLAMMIKPGSPKDLLRNQIRRNKLKNREGRSAPKVNLSHSGDDK